ncbi:MAG: hypothetical protein LBL65_08455 [Campylobacteraceae bacterium]|jgi:hypothetical protein|nr:hypothetical protein [Campylobacteraceae bacterium]
MILIYDFIYRANNGVLENLLEDIAKSTKHYLTKDGDKVSLCVQGSEEELKSFSDILSKTLPFSLFLKDVSVRMVTQWDSLKAIKMPKCEIALPFTQKALSKAKAEFNPFVKNEIGINPDIYPPLIFEDKNTRKKYDDGFKEAFLKAAKIIVDGGYLNIKSKNGYVCVSKLQDKKYENFNVMLTDLSATSKIAVLKSAEISALASLEKPLIKTHSNLIFASNYPNFPRFFDIALANDLFLYLLGVALFEMGIEFVVLEAKQSAPDASLYFENEIKQEERLQVCTLDNGQNIILKGTSSTSPQLLKSIKRVKNPCHMQFALAMHELDLFEDANCGVYLSLKNDDMIMFYSAQTGVLDMVNITYEDSLQEMLESIAKEDATGIRLIENYTEKFPLIVEKAKKISLKQKAKNIANLWSIAAFLMGLDGSLEEARDKLLENISTFGGQKGPRVDYKLIDENSAKTTINAHKFIKSVMSFRLADVDDGLLSYGIAESLVYFLSDFMDGLKSDFQIKNVLLMGSLFGNKTISNLCVKHLGVNHKVHFNKELPIEL